MNKTIPLSSYAMEILLGRQKELLASLGLKTTPTVERQKELNKARKELAEVEHYIDNGFVREFDENQPAAVQIGSVIILENMATGDKREYRIMTASTSDPLRGVISNESPMAQKMLGLNLKNTFKFRDNYGKDDSYKIVSID